MNQTGEGLKSETLSVVLTFYSPTPGATEFSYWATTDRDWVSDLVLTLMDTKFGLLCSLLLCRLGLPAAGKKSTPLSFKSRLGT